MSKDLLGICGLYCGACDNYKAFTPEGKHLLETEKYKNKDLNKLKCKGCNSDSLSDHCGRCEMMKCAKAKGFSYCGQCAEYPCQRILEFYEIGRKFEGARHRLDIIENSKMINELGIDKWLEERQIRWTCKCGHEYTYYESKCIRCGEKLDSYAQTTEV